MSCAFFRIIEMYVCVLWDRKAEKKESPTHTQNNYTMMNDNLLSGCYKCINSTQKKTAFIHVWNKMFNYRCQSNRKTKLVNYLIFFRMFLLIPLAPPALFPFRNTIWNRARYKRNEKEQDRVQCRNCISFNYKADFPLLVAIKFEWGSLMVVLLPKDFSSFGAELVLSVIFNDFIILRLCVCERVSVCMPVRLISILSCCFGFYLSYYCCCCCCYSSRWMLMAAVLGFASKITFILQKWNWVFDCDAKLNEICNVQVLKKFI